MVTKRKKRTKGKSRIDLFALTKRQFAKGIYRDALKGAKACYRQDPTPERRQLLEHALMARAQQLCETRMRDEARAVLESLLDDCSSGRIVDTAFLRAQRLGKNTQAQLLVELYRKVAA